MIYLDSEKVFWALVSAACAAVLALLVLWAVPAHIEAARAVRELEEQEQTLHMLERLKDKIPSARTVEEYAAFRDWVAAQARLVESFFADRTAVLEAPLAGEGEVSPVDFKEAYIQAVKTQRRWLEANKDMMAVPDVSAAFPTYDWVTGPTLPDPKDYKRVLRAYWVRYYLYRALLDGKAVALRRFDIGHVRKGKGLFDELPVYADLLIEPEHVDDLLERLLVVSPSITGMPVMRIDKLVVRRLPGIVPKKPLCAMEITGTILLYTPKRRVGEG